MKRAMKSISVIIIAAWLSFTVGTAVAQKNKTKEKDKGMVEAKAWKDENEKPKKQVEINREVEAPRGSTIHINVANRNLDVRTWNENKVKVVTKVDEGTDVTNMEETFNNIGIALRSVNNRVELTSTQGGNVWFHGPEGELMGTERLMPMKDFTVTVPPDGKHPKAYSFSYSDKAAKGFSYSYSFSNSAKRGLTVYIPEGSKIDLTNKYGDVALTADVKDATISLTNSTLDARKFDNLTLRAKYSTVNIGDVEDAEVEFVNGTFTAGNIKSLDIDSKYSTIEYEAGTDLIMRSQNDNYTIESLSKVEGRKNYGDFRLGRLISSIEVDGSNADIRIKKINAGVTMVKINDKYADIRIPVRDLGNYAVSFKGRYSTVFAPFEKVPMKEPLKEKESSASKEKEEVNTYEALALANSRLMRLSNQGSESMSSNFTATVGNTQKGHTNIELVCNNCNVDFK
jgi:hypothetical protein